MSTRTPSINNPFILPEELSDYPLLYNSLIRVIREIDYNEGKKFLYRYYEGIQYIHNSIAQLVASVWDNLDYELCPDDLLKYLKDQVGFGSEYDYLTQDLSYDDLRRLISLAIPLWKERFSELGLINLIRLLTGKNVAYFTWFDWRAILDEVFLDDSLRVDNFWVIGGEISRFDEFYSQIKVMINGGLDKQLLLDLVELERVLSERIEIALVDFFDRFLYIRDKWETLTGSAASIVDKIFVIPSGTVEKALLCTVDCSNYFLSHDFYLEIGAKCRTFFYVEDWSGGTYYEIESSKNSVKLIQYISGTPTVLANPTLSFPLYEETWYDVRCICLDENSSNRIKIYIDGNKIIDILDSDSNRPESGYVAIGASDNDIDIDNVEIFRVPMKWALVEPSGITTSDNFFDD